MIWSVSFGQDRINVVNYFKKMNTHYAEMSEFDIGVNIYYFDKKGEQVMKESGRVIHSEDLHYLEMAGNTMLRNKGEFLLIDHQRKAIMYQSIGKDYKEAEPKGSQEGAMDINAMLDSLWANQEHLNCHIEENTESHVMITITDQKNEFYNGYQIKINKKDYSLLEYTYFIKNRYDEENPISQVSIIYHNETDRPSLKHDWLSVKHYLTISSKRISPSKEFSGYTVIDQTQKSE